MQNILSILAKKWKLLILVGIIFTIVSLAVSFIFPLEYRADTQILVISKSRYGVDPYTVAKSGEKVGDNLTEIVKTTDFYNKVMSQANYNFNRDQFSNLSEINRRKKWNKAVQASVIYGTGVLNISAYGKTSSEAVQLAGAVGGALVNQGWEYVGGDFFMKVINDPVSTRFPARPNLLVNGLLAFLAGIILAGLAVTKKYSN